MKITSVFTFLVLCLFLSFAYSQEVKLIPEDATTTKLVRLHIVVGDYIMTSVVEVDAQLFNKIPSSKEPTLSAATYRLTADHTNVEAYNPIGQALKISDTQIAIILDKKLKASANLLSETLNTGDELKRHAVLFYIPKLNESSLEFTGKPANKFIAEIQPRISNGGLVAYPVNIGIRPFLTSCTCKAFFGCTTGCCTSPSCKAIIGICQSNSECKKVDSLSNCSCSE